MPIRDCVWLRIQKQHSSTSETAPITSETVPGRKLPALKSMQREAGSPSERDIDTEILALDAAGPEDKVLFSLEMII